MSGVRVTALALKRWLGGGYRSAQRVIAHVVFERGLRVEVFRSKRPQR